MQSACCLILKMPSISQNEWVESFVAAFEVWTVTMPVMGHLRNYLMYHQQEHNALRVINIYCSVIHSLHGFIHILVLCPVLSMCSNTLLGGTAGNISFYMRQRSQFSLLWKQKRKKFHLFWVLLLSWLGQILFLGLDLVVSKLFFLYKCTKPFLP